MNDWRETDGALLWRTVEGVCDNGGTGASDHLFGRLQKTTENQRQQLQV